MKKLRRLVTQRRKVRVFIRRESGKISFLTIPPHSQLIPQPQRRIARSHSVLLVIIIMININLCRAVSIKILNCVLHKKKLNMETKPNLQVQNFLINKFRLERDSSVDGRRVMWRDVKGHVMVSPSDHFHFLQFRFSSYRTISCFIKSNFLGISGGRWVILRWIFSLT